MEEISFFKNEEIDYIIKNYELLGFSDLCKSLRTKILLRTGKSYSDSMIINNIRKMNPQKKRYTFETTEAREPDKERIKKISINRI